MTVNVWGEIVQEEWFNTAIVRPYVDLDAFVVMPNHIHGIIVIAESQSGKVVEAKGDGEPMRVWQRQTPTTPQPAFGKPIHGALGTIVGAFKAVVTKRINTLRDTPQTPFWQRNFYDNIILDERILNQFRFYIENNPSQWATDRHRPPYEK
jgi:putative transposase